MTLIVGIFCDDGVVIGADGQATFGAVGLRTIQQQVKKVSKIGDSIAIATSGPVGLGQQFQTELDSLWTNGKLSGKTPHEAMAIIRAAFWPHVEPEFVAAKATVPVLGNAALESAISYTMVAIVLKKKPFLIQFNQQCSPELATQALPFISLGSGQQLADPFLAFLRRIFWSDRQPKVSEGVLATLWSLKQAIRTNPGGVGDPIQIMTLERDEKGDFKIRELAEADLAEHEQAIAGAESALRGYRENMQPRGAVVGEEGPPIPGKR
jgi:predicted proteasome-type protease